jgi:hypothetical protein
MVNTITVSVCKSVASLLSTLYNIVFVLAIFHLESDNETNKIVRWKMKELLKLVRSSAVHFEMERGEEKNRINYSRPIRFPRRPLSISSR